MTGTLRRPARGLRHSPRGLRHSPREQKGRDTHGFPSSLNSYLSFEGLGADGRLRKQEKEYGRGFFLPRGIRIFAVSVSELLHIRFTLRRTDITVSVKFFTCADYPNPTGIGNMHLPTCCAARISPRGPSLALRAIHLVPRLRRVNRLCSSKLSGTANR